jgi:hypothetical protein
VTLLLAFVVSSTLFSKFFTPLIGSKQVYLWKRCVTFFGGNFAGLGLLRWISFKLNLINTETSEKHDQARKDSPPVSKQVKSAKGTLMKQKKKSK